VSETSEREAYQDLLAKLDPETFGMFAEADLGRQAQEFLTSDLGRYMVGCAQQEHQEAVRQWKRTAFWRVRRIRELQNRAWRAEQFMFWLRDLIIRGRSAERLLGESET